MCFYKDFSSLFGSIISISYIKSAALFCVFLRDPVGPFSKDANVNKAPPTVPRPSDKTGEFNDAYIHNEYSSKSNKLIYFRLK